jgi:antitoxin component of MazEF toxin-antitoxin module
MVTKVQKWGNRQRVRLTRQMLEDVGIAVLDACIY